MDDLNSLCSWKWCLIFLRMSTQFPCSEAIPLQIVNTQIQSKSHSGSYNPIFTNQHSLWFKSWRSKHLTDSACKRCCRTGLCELVDSLLLLIHLFGQLFYTFDHWQKLWKGFPVHLIPHCIVQTIKDIQYPWIFILWQTATGLVLWLW